MLGTIFERFVEQSPASVMVRGLLERILAAPKIDALFEATAQVQYTRELLFSELVNLMSLVVCAVYPSVNAAYSARVQQLSVSRTAVYDKLNRVEPEVSAALVRQSAKEMASLVEAMGGLPAWVEGYRTRLVDGTCLAGTDHRLAVLRDSAAKALPGKGLVVFDPALKLAVDVFLCPDGHAQERTLFADWLASVQAQDLWIADRNMSTLGVLFGLQERQAAFVIRQHQNLPWSALSELQIQGTNETAQVFEQLVELQHQEQQLQIRRILVQLNQPTRNGEQQLSILTSLPLEAADAMQVAQLYRQRWTIETFFQSLTAQFEGEIQTLAYPQAALFSFCLALLAHNVLALVQAALRSVHGAGKVEAALSLYYLVDEVQATYRGMMIAIEPSHWLLFQSCSQDQLLDLLHTLAAQVRLAAFLKHPRSPKKNKPKPKRNPKQGHLSTHRLLHKREKAP